VFRRFRLELIHYENDIEDHGRKLGSIHHQKPDIIVHHEQHDSDKYTKEEGKKDERKNNEKK
jgi:hypothetical protein